jgi:hypothetical protein
MVCARKDPDLLISMDFLRPTNPCCRFDRYYPRQRLIRLLAKLLDEKLKPLSINKFTVIDPLKFAEDVRWLKVDAEEILVSYDVSYVSFHKRSR